MATWVAAHPNIVETESTIKKATVRWWTHDLFMAQPPRNEIFWKKTNWKKCPASTNRCDNPILSLRVFDTSMAQK
jgi:hypothetical protein